MQKKEGGCCVARRGTDGAIILETKVDTAGIEEGKRSIKAATESTNKHIRSLGVELSKALNAGDVKSAQLISNLKKIREEMQLQVEKAEKLKTKLKGLEGGEVKIQDKGVSKLQSDFDKANVSIDKTQNEINEVYMQLERLQSNAFKSSSGTVILTGSEQAEFNALNARLDELEPKLEKNKQKARELGVALKDATGAATQKEIEKTKNKLSETEHKIEELSTKAEIAGKKIENNVGSSSKKISLASNGLGDMGKRFLNLAKGALIFSTITKAFTAFRNTIGSALMSNEQFRHSVELLQASLWTVSQPIYQAILPGLQTLIKWLTIGVLYVATFFSALGGKTLKQTIASAKALNAQAQAYNNVAKSSKEARKQLAGFDDINILQNGVASTGVNLSGINNSFDDLESLLNDSDMQNLQNFEQWVIQNKDSIITALEIAGLGLLGLAISGVIGKIGSLLGWFNKKDKGLDRQTKKTKTETDAVKDLSNAWALAPAFAYALIPALDGLTESGMSLIPVFQTSTDKALGLFPALDSTTESASVLSPALDGVTNSAYNLSPALDGAANSVVAMDNAAAVAAPNIETNIETAMDNSTSNVKTFSTETKASISNWSTSVQQNAINAMKVVADNIYESLNSSGININNFINTTSTNFANWGTNVSANVSNTAKNIATNFGSALSSAWTNFKNFMIATGEKISGFWNEHKATIITVGVLTGLTVAGIALAPYTGGASLALPALAKGGIVPHATTALIGEAGKEAVLPLENNTEWMDMLADRIASRNGGSGGSTTVVLEIDGREFGRAVVEQGDKEKRRIGTRLVMA